MAKWINEESLKKLSDKELDVLERNISEKKSHSDYETAISLIIQEKQRRLSIKPIKQQSQKIRKASTTFICLDFNGMNEDEALNLLAKNFLNHKLVDEVELAVQRKRKIQNARNQKLSDLWRDYVICAFSSQEKSAVGLALDLFVNGNSELLDLESVSKNEADTDWIRSLLVEVKLHGKIGKKIKTIQSAYRQFFNAGGSAMLLAQCDSKSPLEIFINLASGYKSDKNLEDSIKFSENLDSEQFFNIGPKQLRNILVNSGLAVNVIPLDSRWQKEIAKALGVQEENIMAKHILKTSSLTVLKKVELNNLRHYLYLENFIRRAYLLIKEKRPDIENLALLDAIVFRSYG